MGLFNRKSSKQEDADVLKANETKEKVKWSRRPANTAFKQQRLKAWQPILTPATVLPTFFLVGLIFVPLGGVLLWGSNQVKEFTIDYTQCEFVAPNTSFDALPTSAYNYHVDSSSPVTPPTWQFTHDAAETNASIANVCRLQFQLPADMKAPVFMYYKLTNYYQNHRRYVKSIDSDQLKGAAKSASDISGGECKPLAVIGNMPVFPCGLIANSVFNDTFLPPVLVNPSGSSGNVTYNMTSKGIAWPGEAKKYTKSNYANDQAVPPPNWHDRYPDGYTDANPIPDLSQDEHFQVWMRTAGLPTFRKLYFRNDDETMAAGEYEIEIYMNYPVQPYGGTKSIVFSTVSFIGGRNPFLGIAYIAVGGVCVLLGLVLTLRHLIKPRKLGDPQFLSWNKAGAH
ncbi:ligand-effect modulator 3 family [Leucosporidium creatinivorum]|uniref:Ligand-effect modulator 3 family n=1 Tax=Leucosporidium creatinivorum TaxID=106004 RepID=A0A1Y2EWW5_9BASI|nr:ligand-effect modulator 3 family [Leucosporidium creatinivorum]